ncbi:MAG: dTMP kinase [Rhodobacteraceae bacterium]|nr:dTMP kinase [Paracoccaceae bacterium]
MSFPGTFITFEGIDGSGKSTLARELSRRLRAKGHEVVLTREPGGSAGGEAIRELMLDGKRFGWATETEILLFHAARRDHVDKTIAPALKAGKTVVCDRFADSTRVYQGLGSPRLQETIAWLHREMIEIEPDLTFIIDVPPSIAVERARSRSKGDWRLEGLGKECMQKIVAAFADLAVTHADRCRLVDNSRATVEETVQEILEACLKVLNGRE